MNSIKRILGASLLAIGMTIILLGLATAAGIIVVISCPVFALGLGVKYFEESKPAKARNWEESKGSLL